MVDSVVLSEVLQQGRLLVLRVLDREVERHAVLGDRDFAGRQRLVVADVQHMHALHHPSGIGARSVTGKSHADVLSPVLAWLAAPAHGLGRVNHVFCPSHVATRPGAHLDGSVPGCNGNDPEPGPAALIGIFVARTVKEPDRLDPDGVESKAEAREVFKSANVESDIYFTNGLDYADLMESGLKSGYGSKQAPEGMVSVNIRRWPFIVADFSRRFV